MCALSMEAQDSEEGHCETQCILVRREVSTNQRTIGAVKVLRTNEVASCYRKSRNRRKALSGGRGFVGVG